ncbi:tetratricopeptide repeat protein [Rhabdochromatium marinum]|uniref:O-linked N-acetylglucosamine transferase, SPINDLY family protein n=1 Tax=Rhabdochromatium marinum TaxID=48729 RepID=UPI0019035C2E|nr:glycosyltransferase family 41 protein [Rhabdochromatium marinum]MBK1647619.1 hypothetical protein [Rhabdochromatium marinum]
MRPDLTEAAQGQAILLAHQGQLEPALEHFLELNRLAPDQATTLHNIGITLNRLERYAQAVPWFKRALSLAPGFADAWTGLAAAHAELGQDAAAHEAVERAVAASPAAPLPRLMQAMLCLPAVAETVELSNSAPEQFARALAALADWADQDPRHLHGLGERVGDRQPFALAYRPGNHRALLGAYGDLMARAARACWQARGLLPMPLPPARPRVRLAILSAHIRRHSVWDIILKGLVRHRLRTWFELTIYHTGTEVDAETAWAKRHVERFVSGPRGHAEWLRLIREDAPDVLFLPEVGMDPLTCKLGALRLAPLQVASWGHPITTGLPEIDLFFSGEQLEPPDAQEHYRERLIRLPGTGVCTEWPDLAPAALPIGYLRARSPERVRLLLCQQPFKFDPADWPLILEVLRACAPCELYLLQHRRLSAASRQATDRLRETLDNAGLETDTILLERPWLPRAQFLSLLEAVDLYLDLPAFSGYTTAWQALHCGLPIITLQGASLRQRLAAGLLRQIEQTDTIARDAADYVAIAARLAAECRDPDAREIRRARLKGAASKADHQVDSVRALEQALLDALAERGRDPRSAPQSTQTTALTALRAVYREGERAVARAAAEHYVATWPDCTVGWTILAKLCESDRDWHQASAAAQQLCTLQPEVVWNWSYLGLLLKRQGRLSDAVQALSKALTLAPTEAETLNLLGIVHMQQGQPAKAESCFRQALAKCPELSEAWNNLGTALRDLDRIDESMLTFWQAVSLSPENGRARSNLLFSQAYTAALMPERLCQEARLWEREVLRADERAQARQRRFSRPRPRDQRLRLGVLSAEFGKHAVGDFLLSWLRALDREHCTLYLYPSVERYEPEAGYFKALADVWCPIDTLSDAQAAAQMRADGIDVLVETSGHTVNNRLGVIAHRAAPVQCHYIGYFATTGLAEMDYFIADSVLVPPEHDHHYTERVWRLPRTRYVYEPLQQAPEPHWQPDPRSVLRLGSFNNLTKVRQETLALWGAVLRALPHARLLLKDRRAMDEGVQARILSRLQEQGVSADRVEFLGTFATWAEHMSAYNRIDIALDTLPFSSATTGFEALWMGVPLITLAGDRFAGRQAASMLSGLGRHEWIATDDQDYVRIVTALAADREQRQGLRAELRTAMQTSELCDGTGLARVLEQAFRQMLAQSPFFA